MDVRAIAWRWFVRYNPLFFVSATCVLAGVFLVAQGLPREALSTHVIVGAVTESYVFLLIAAAWLLLRAGLRRPATILGLTAVVFIFDASMNGERLTTLAGMIGLPRAQRAMGMSLCLGTLSAVQLLVLARVFRLDGVSSLLAIACVTAFALPLLPWLVEAVGSGESERQAAYLAIVWVGAPLVAWAVAPTTRVGLSRLATDDWSTTVTRRVLTAAPGFVAFMYAGHAIAWSSFLSGATFAPSHAAPYVLAGGLALVARLTPVALREAAAWIATSAALALTLGSPPLLGAGPQAIIALCAAGGLAALRLLLPATLAAFGGAFLIAGGLYAPAWPAALSAALLAGAVVQRDPRAFIASGLAATSAVYEARGVWVPRSMVAWGVFLLGTGFLLLFAGVAVSLAGRRWIPGNGVGARAVSRE